MPLSTVLAPGVPIGLGVPAWSRPPTAGTPGGPPSGPAGGDLAGTYPNPVLTNVFAGGSFVFASITVDTKGRITAASNGIPPGGGAPSGPAGGDLTGTYPNPTLVAVVTPGSFTYASITIDAAGRVTAAANGAPPVAPPSTLPPSGPAGGDLAGTYPNPTLAALWAGGTFTYSSITVDSKGRVTAASSGVPPTFPASLPPSGPAGGDLAGTYPNPTLPAIVTAGSFTNANITIDAKGRVTAASNGSAGGGGSGTVNAGLLNQLAYYAAAGTAVSGAAAAAVIAGGLALFGGAGSSILTLQNNATGFTATDGTAIYHGAGGADLRIWNYENGNVRIATNNAEVLTIGVTATQMLTQTSIGNTATDYAGGGVLFLKGLTMGMRFQTRTTGMVMEAVDNTGITSYQPLAIGGSIIYIQNSNVNRAIVQNNEFQIIQVGRLTGTFPSFVYSDTQAGTSPTAGALMRYSGGGDNTWYMQFNTAGTNDFASVGQIYRVATQFMQTYVPLGVMTNPNLLAGTQLQLPPYGVIGAAGMANNLGYYTVGGTAGWYYTQGNTGHNSASMSIGGNGSIFSIFYTPTLATGAANTPAPGVVMGANMDTAGLLVVPGGLSAGTSLGVAKMGTGIAGYAEFSNAAVFASTKYALIQASDGTTILNTGTSALYMRSGNATVATMGVNGFEVGAYGTPFRDWSIGVNATATNGSAAMYVHSLGTGVASFTLSNTGRTSGWDIDFNYPAAGNLSFYNLAAGVVTMLMDSTSINVTGFIRAQAGPGSHQISLISTGGVCYLGTQTADDFTIIRNGAAVGTFNANGLDGCKIGSVTPQPGAFTSLEATTAFQIDAGVKGYSLGGGNIGNSVLGTATGSIGNLELQNNGTGACFVSYHRTGSFAAYMGLDTDNIFKVGGWSMGAVAYRLILGDTYANAGELRMTGNITAYYSDDRLKDRLGTIPNALEKVRCLEGFYYQANAVAQKLGYHPVREVGLSAQRMQAVLPEVVAPAPIDPQYLTIHYERVTALLVEAIKELDAEFRQYRLAHP